MEEPKKEEITKDFLKALSDLEDIAEVENMIKNNSIEFEIDSVKYRVRHPSMEEQRELEQYKRKKYIEFVSDNTMKFQKQWIVLYKEKGIDIEEMEQQIIQKQHQIEQLMVKLATTNENQRAEELKQEILSLRGEQALLNIEKTDMLSYSIEDQLLVAVGSYYTYLVLEKSEKENWAKVYSNFDEFSKSKETKLIHKAFYYVNQLIYVLGI